MSPLGTLLLAAGLALQAGAKTIRVDVGKTGLSFTPNSFAADPNDVIEFWYYPRNHSVVAGRWNDACVPATSGGFYSGFFPTPEGTNPDVFRVTVNDTDPIVFYCSQNNGFHCRNGMVAVVNPAGSNNLQNYLAIATNTDTAATSPDSGPFGGVRVNVNSTGVVTTTTTTSGESTAAPTATDSSETSGSSSVDATSTAEPSASPTGTSGGSVVGVSLAGLVAAGVLGVFLVGDLRG